jgi:flagellar FliL protein
MSIARRACLMLLCLLPLTALAKSAEKAEEGGPGFEYIEMTPAFVVNFGAAGRIGYLKTDVSLRVSAETAGAVRLHMPALRHELIMLLSSQSAEALAAPEQREALRLAALEAVRKVIAAAAGHPPAAGDAKPAETGVQDLLFTSFILQR